MAKDVITRFRAYFGDYDPNIAKARRQLEGFKKDNLSVGGVMKQLSGSLVSAAARFTSVTAAVGALSSAIMSNIATARNFEKSMSQLSSLTGKTGGELNQLKDYAIELGSKTTLSASEVADAFKMIGSQQPQLLKSGQALKDVTQYAITLSEAADIELATAAQTLSTSINQFGGDSSKAAEFVNVLAAASQQGAGDIAWLGEAITKSGTTAKAVNTSYQELVANLEILAKAGYDASTAGTALRSIIMSLEKQANNDFKPSVVGLTQAFSNLNDAQLTLTQYQETAGKMFAAQAKALAEGATEAAKLKDGITGTNTAMEQAKTNTDNLDGSLKSLSSAWEGLNLHINNSNGFLKSAVDWLKDVVTWADQAFTASGRAQKRLQELNGGGGGTSTRVEQEIAHLGVAGNRGQQWKYFNMVRDAYNEQIRSLKDDMSKVPESSRTWERLNIDLQSYKSMRDEFVSRGMQYMDSTDPNKVLPNEENIKVTVDDEEAVESLSGLKARLKELRKLRDLSIDNADYGARDYYNNEIKELQARIKKLQGTTAQKYVPVAGSADYLQKYIKDMTTQRNAATNQAERDRMNGLIFYAEKMLDRMLNKIDKKGYLVDDNSSLSKRLGIEPFKTDGKKIKDGADTYMPQKENNLFSSYNKVVGGLSSISGGLKQMGIEVPESVDKLLGALQGVSSIISGVTSIIEAFGIGATTANTTAVAANTAAVIGLTGVIGTNTFSNFIPFFSGGGMVHAANGFMVPGNHLSNDMVPAMVNSGEIILNRAQQGIIANDLQNSGMRNLNLQAVIYGDQIRMVLNNTSKTKMQGQYITSRSR